MRTNIPVQQDCRTYDQYKNSTVFPYTSNTQFQMKLKKKQKGI